MDMKTQSILGVQLFPLPRDFFYCLFLGTKHKAGDCASPRVKGETYTATQTICLATPTAIGGAANEGFRIAIEDLRTGVKSP